jgi:ABC-type sugar transport system ATPase subunit
VRDVRHYGVETIYQTLALADNVDAAANLYLGRESKRGRFPGRGRQAVLSFHLELAGQFLGLGGVTALKV